MTHSPPCVSSVVTRYLPPADDGSAKRSSLGDVPAVLAQEIQDRRFATAFRGYDPTEVRQFLAHVAGLYGDLQSRVTRITEGEVVAVALAEGAGSTDDVASDSMTESIVAADLAAEATRADAQRMADDLLAAARSEAQTIVSRANDEAARIVLRARAESRGKPSAERNAAIEAALAEVPGDPEQAREQARLMISEARAVRERILADLAKRRRTAHVQLEQLRVAREKLLETLRDARRVVEDASRDLSTAEVEARLAAETAGRRVANEAMPSTDELEAELFGGRYAQSPSRSLPEDEAADVTVAAIVSEQVVVEEVVVAEEVVVVAVVIDEVLVDDEVLVIGEVPVDDAVLVIDEVLVHGEVVVESVVLADTLGEETTVADGGAVAPAIEDRVADRVDGTIAEAAAASFVTEPAGDLAGAADENTVPATATNDPADIGGVSGAGTVGVVDDLFARLRAERTEAAENARQVLAAEPATKVRKPRAPRANRAAVDHLAATPDVVPPTPVVVIDMTVEADVVDDAGTENDIPSVDIGRDPADVAAVAAQRLARSIKRHLSDEQGSALVSLRTARGLPHIDALVGPEQEQRERLAEVVNRSLIDSGTSLADGDLDPVVDDVVGEVRSALSEAIALVRDGSASVSDLPEAIAAAYRAWTTERLDALLRRIAPMAA